MRRIPLITFERILLHEECFCFWFHFSPYKINKALIGSPSRKSGLRQECEADADCDQNLQCGCNKKCFGCVENGGLQDCYTMQNEEETQLCFRTFPKQNKRTKDFWFSLKKQLKRNQYKKQGDPIFLRENEYYNNDN